MDITPARVAHIPCSRCGEPADVIELFGPRPYAELRRTSFTSVLRQPISTETFESVRQFLDPPRPAALHALDPEFVPCWCPECLAAYCGAHWTTRDVFDDDGHHDSIRGRCPEGHERMLED